MNLSEARIIELGKFGDRRGNLSIVEEERTVPFEIKRAYWIYDVPGGEKRGAHAYKKNKEFIIAVSGSFDVVLGDGRDSRRFTLNRAYNGLYAPEGLWREMEEFSTNSVALIISSEEYSEDDYIMDYEEFKKWREGR